jgi:lipoprotein-releasing system permease protein
VFVAMTISLLATIYPAWRASRMDPAEALRYE